MNGWIKLHRRLTKWEWFSDAPTLQLAIYCLLEANYAPSKWQGIVINRGQLITGRKQLALELGQSEQQIRTRLDRLMKCDFLTTKSTNRFTLVTIVNYDLYQNLEDQSTSQLTNQQPTDNQWITTLKEEKEIKKKKNIGFQPPEITEIITHFEKKGLNGLSEIEASKFWNFYESKGWLVGKAKMKNWKAAATNWANRIQKPTDQNPTFVTA